MPSNLIAFSLAALVLLIIPGPGVMYVVARSLGQGRRAGLVSALGLSTGVLVHVFAAVAGLSAILMTSATAFGVVKLLGAAYLIYLGIETLRSSPSAEAIETVQPRSMRRLFKDGVVVSALNPKIAVFFLAFLPQFTDPTRGPVWAQALFLGILYAIMAVVTDSGYALLAGSLRPLLTRRAGAGRWLRWVTGSVYIGLGLTTALAGSGERR